MTENEFFDKYDNVNLSDVELAEKVIMEDVESGMLYALAHNLLTSTARFINYLNEAQFRNF